MKYGLVTAVWFAAAALSGGPYHFQRAPDTNPFALVFRANPFRDFEYALTCTCALTAASFTPDGGAHFFIAGIVGSAANTAKRRRSGYANRQPRSWSVVRWWCSVLRIRRH